MCLKSRAGMRESKTEARARCATPNARLCARDDVIDYGCSAGHADFFLGYEAEGRRKKRSAEKDEF